MIVIGLTGPNASGKGEISSYIKKKGFVYHSLSDALREESKKSSISPERENLINIGNEIRLKNGPDILAVRIINKLTEGKNHIVDSIRNPAEVEALKKIDGFILIGIDAPLEIRFERSLKRNRQGDAKTIKDFIEKEAKENKDSIENQQLKTCFNMADIIITNDSTINDLHNKLDEILKTYEKA